MTRKIKLFFEKTMMMFLKSTSGLTVKPVRMAWIAGILPDE